MHILLWGSSSKYTATFVTKRSAILLRLLLWIWVVHNIIPKVQACTNQCETSVTVQNSSRDLNLELWALGFFAVVLFFWLGNSWFDEGSQLKISLIKDSDYRPNHVTHTFISVNECYLFSYFVIIFSKSAILCETTLNYLHNNDCVPIPWFHCICKVR